MKGVTIYYKEQKRRGARELLRKVVEIETNDGFDDRWDTT